MPRPARSAPSFADAVLPDPAGGPSRSAPGLPLRAVAHLMDLLLVGTLQAVCVLVAIWPTITRSARQLALRQDASPLDALTELLDALQGSWTAALAGLAAAVVLGGLYEVTMTYKLGGTVGKMVCSLRVLDAETLQPPTLRQCLVRWAGPTVFTGTANLVPFVNLVPLAGYLWCAVDARNQAVHDHLARTVVVRTAPLRAGATTTPRPLEPHQAKEQPHGPALSSSDGHAQRDRTDT